MQGANMLVQSVGTLNSSIGSAKLNKKNRKFAAEQQQKLMDYNAAENEKAYQRNLDMWNKVNAYNSPASQVQRLIDAGLNPNLAYGNVSTGNADAAPQVQPNQAVPIDSAGYSDYFQPLMQGFRDMASNSLAMAQTAKTLSENTKVKEEYYALQLNNASLPDFIKATYQGLIKDNDIKDVNKDSLLQNLNILSQQYEREKTLVRSAKEEYSQLVKNGEKLDIELAIAKATKDFKIEIEGASAEYQRELTAYYKKMWKKLLTEKDYDLQQAFNDLFSSNLYTQALKSRQTIVFQGYQNQIEDFGNTTFGNERKSYYETNKFLPLFLKRKVGTATGLFGDFMYATEEIFPKILQIAPRVGYSKSPKGTSYSIGM